MGAARIIAAYSRTPEVRICFSDARPCDRVYIEARELRLTGLLIFTLLHTCSQSGWGRWQAAACSSELVTSYRWGAEARNPVKVERVDAVAYAAGTGCGPSTDRLATGFQVVVIRTARR